MAEPATADSAAPSQSELALENERLRASIVQLRESLQAGHTQLCEALTMVLAASSTEQQQQRAIRVSEHHVAAYIAFLRRAVDIASELSNACNDSGHRQPRRSRIRTLLSLFRCRSRAPARVMPPTRAPEITCSASVS